MLKCRTWHCALRSLRHIGLGELAKTFGIPRSGKEVTESDPYYCSSASGAMGDISSGSLNKHHWRAGHSRLCRSVFYGLSGPGRNLRWLTDLFQPEECRELSVETSEINFMEAGAEIDSLIRPCKFPVNSLFRLAAQRAVVPQNVQFRELESDFEGLKSANFPYFSLLAANSGGEGLVPDCTLRQITDSKNLYSVFSTSNKRLIPKFAPA